MKRVTKSDKEYIHSLVSHSHCFYLDMEEFSTSHVVTHNNYFVNHIFSYIYVRIVVDCDALLVVNISFPHFQ